MKMCKNGWYFERYVWILENKEFVVSFGHIVDKRDSTPRSLHSCSGGSLQDWKQLLEIRVREGCFAVAEEK